MDTPVITVTLWAMGSNGQSQEMILGETGLRPALQEPTCICIEQGQDRTVPALEKGLLLRLSSRTIFASGDLGESFTDAMIDRHWLDAARRDHMILALHEALANAVIHGSLDISNNDVLDIQSFIQQGNAIENRIDDPVYGLMPITLTAQKVDTGLEVTIHDCGRGFIAEECWRNPDDLAPELKHGRGMGLMQVSSDAMHYEDHGRKVVLLFEAGDNPS